MKNAKFKLLCATIISTALLCSSCGSGHESSEIVPTDETTGMADEQIADSTAETEDIQAPADENVQDDETTSDDTEQSGGVSIEMQTVEDKDTAEDGTVIYIRSYSQPTVTIAGNEAASEKINADIQSRIDSFTASEQMRNEAREYYEVTLAEEDFMFREYIESLTFAVSRNDTSVISFVMTTYMDTGGAHGLNGNFGINYDAKTGEIIDFSDLSEDSDKFYNDTLEYNRELAQTDEYKERMFEEGFLGEDEFENVLYADEKWYLSDEGLVFISNPYELGPYAAGTIEFVIPYDKLIEQGLKEEYDLPSNP